MLAVSCVSGPSGPQRIERSQPLLGTFVVVAVRSSDRARADAAIALAFDEVRRLDSILSLHRPDSELAHLNREAAHGRVSVSEDLFRVLEKAQEISIAADGSFDVTIRPLADLWGFIKKEYHLPKSEQIEAVLPRVNYRFVTLDPVQRTVHFGATNISVDLGGIAKGYIVDRAIEVLRAHGFADALVRAGGDLRVNGAWEVQLEDSRKQGRRSRIHLRNAAISTSGDYENYFPAEGKRYGHILNPRTGWPVEGIAACTAIAPTCMESDALATACFVLGPEGAKQRFAEKYAMRFVLTGGNVVKLGDFPKEH